MSCFLVLLLGKMALLTYSGSCRPKGTPTFSLPSTTGFDVSTGATGGGRMHAATTKAVVPNAIESFFTLLSRQKLVGYQYISATMVITSLSGVAFC